MWESMISVMREHWSIASCLFFLNGGVDGVVHRVLECTHSSIWRETTLKDLGGEKKLAKLQPHPKGRVSERGVVVNGVGGPSMQENGRSE